MPRRSQLYGVPRDWVARGGWPNGTFYADTPPEVAYAAAISRSLAEAVAGRNKTQLAADMQLERSTIYDLLGGRSWADTVTLAKLERHFGVHLWDHSPDPLPLIRQRRAAEAATTRA